MRILEVREKTITLSRYADPAIPSGGLTTSLVVVTADTGTGLARGLGFASVGRFAQGGLIRDRFAPRLCAADDITSPIDAWSKMMTGEKPGGHGERCVAVGAVDMALWDLFAKQAGEPLWSYAAKTLNRKSRLTRVPVYASGGYVYPENDIDNLARELVAFRDQGYMRAKIKLGATSLARDRARIEAALSVIGDPSRLAVDAIYAFDQTTLPAFLSGVADLGLWWFEDPCDPLDYTLMAEAVSQYPHAMAMGEATFSTLDVLNLVRHSGFRADRDILLMDPAHCYGLTEYARMVDRLEGEGIARNRLWPHGGHLFTLHAAAALDLGGTESNPSSFQPICGLHPGADIRDGTVDLPDLPGIGFEARPQAKAMFDDLLA